MLKIESSQNSYFFILGNYPALSVAELYTLFNLQGLLYEFVVTATDYVIVNFISELPIQSLLSRLGGCIKFGKIISQPSIFPEVEDFCLQFSDVTKVFLGFSIYPQVSAGMYKQKLFKIGLELKKKLRIQGISCRLVTSREANLSAVVVAHNKLLTTQGKELVILKNNNKFFIGETIDVQPFADLSKRDYGRPQRDSQSGMIPPKLALMMLNLSMTKNKENILDPFCGSGTILQEAVWQGRTNLYGSDISARAIADTQQNLFWLAKEFALSLPVVQLLNADVASLTQLSLPKMVAIVTEPDLGNPKVNYRQINQEVERLRNLYIIAYKSFYKLLVVGGRVVMVWPVFFGKVYLLLEKEVALLGFKKVEVLSKKLQQSYHLNERNNLYYARADQKVGREITVWEKV
jgi:tRNA G10  N-methylase Trm11